MPLNERSEKNLEGVHEDLQKVVRRAHELAEAAGLDFIITEGVRSMRRQRELMAAGATRTMKSRHLTGHAVDFAPLISGVVSWKWPPFYTLADLFKQAAAESGVAIQWGGDWRTFKDGPHIELDREKYPA